MGSLVRSPVWQNACINYSHLVLVNRERVALSGIVYYMYDNRDMTEKMLKATLNPNTPTFSMRAGVQQKVQVCMCVHRRLRSVCASAQHDQSSLDALCVAKGSMSLQAKYKDTYQTVQMCRLI